MAVDEDIDFGGGDSGAIHARRYQLGMEPEGGGDGLQFLQRNTGVYGGGEKHVSTDSGETIQVGYAHCESEGRWPEVQV